MKYARIVNNTAVDVRTESPEGCFTPNIVAEFVTVPDEVQNGWWKDGTRWASPAPPAVPAPTAPVPPTVSPIEFLLLFTAPERVAIKAARDTDPMVADFLSIVEDTRLTGVNLALQSTQDALTYLVTASFITAARKAEILLGKVL